MSRGGRIILVAVLVVVSLLVLRAAATAVYFGPRAELTGQIERHQTNLSNIRTAAKRHIDLKEEMQALADRTLGATREEVEAGLRARLNRIGEEVALASASVSTGQQRPRSSPMDRADLRDNPLRDELDFVELDGTISGEGTLAQALEVVDRIEAAPWLKRINSVVIDPKDGGERFGITVRLTTVFLPTAPPGTDALNHQTTAYDGGGFAALRTVMDSNPFRVPPAPVVAEAPTQPDPPAEAPRDPPYDYAQWRISMITDSSRGREVWLINTQSNESRTLAAGESLRDLCFIGAGADTAEFRLGDQRFTVEVGATLAEQTAIEE